MPRSQTSVILHVTVAAATLPEPLRAALHDLGRRRVRGKTVFQQPSVKSMEKAVRGLIRSARKHGLPDLIDIDTATAFVEDMNRRDHIKAITRKSYVDGLVMFLRHTDPDNPAIQLVVEDSELFREDSLLETKRKADRLAALPITLGDVAKAAAEWRRLALTAEPALWDNAWRRLWLGSAIMALLTVRPFRVTDLLRLVIGRTLFRRSGDWYVDIVTSKRGTQIRGPLPAELTGYLDAALLQGAHCQTEATFMELYARRHGTALFSKPDGSPYSGAWVFELCTEAYAHGPHMARSLFFDKLAGRGKDTRASGQYVAGHRSAGSRAAYEMNADEILMKQGEAALSAGIADLRKRQG